MAEGQEQRERPQEGEESQAEEQERREETPFDANPPVDPTEPQVGNSRARFFMPREEGSEEGSDGDAAEGEDEDDEEAGAEG